VTDFDGVASLLILAATLVGILWRPRGISEAWIAAAGGVAMVLIGPMPVRDLPDLLRSTADVLLFLTGMMLLTVVVERAGVFDVLAEGCARFARGSGITLFCLVFLLGAIVTALLSLDVTVVVLTPIVYAVTMRRRIDALPFMFACTFVANTASLILPVSNLTNLLLYQQLDLGFLDFARTMWLPNLVAVGVNLLVFLGIFRKRIPRRFSTEAHEELPALDWWFWVAALVLGLTLIGLLWSGIEHIPLALAALGGAVVLLSIGYAGNRLSVRDGLREVSWPVLVFVIGMLVLIRGFEEGWLGDRVFEMPHSLGGAILAAAGATAIGSNIVNNVPMALLSVPVIQRSSGEHQTALTYAVLLGTNIGPILTTYGSLATMLWLSLVRKRGIDVTTRQYLRVGVLSMPPILVSSAIALWFQLR
jgi:arsenical pump membrane protein